MSQIEKIMKAIIDETSYDEEPQSRIEKQLISILKNEPYEDELQSRIEILIELVREYFSSLLEAEETLKAVIDKSITKIDIPAGITKIGGYLFYNCVNLTSVTIPDTVTVVDHNSFRGCSSLTSVTIPDGVVNIGSAAFYGCSSLTTINIPSSVTTIGSTSIFQNCTNLENVTLGKGFNANGLDLSASTLYSKEILGKMLYNLADRTGQTAYTITIGSTNIAKLSESMIAIATEKNWTLA